MGVPVYGGAATVPPVRSLVTVLPFKPRRIGPYLPSHPLVMVQAVAGFESGRSPLDTCDQGSDAVLPQAASREPSIVEVSLPPDGDRPRVG
jgi:hypothetical protein